MKIRTRSVDLRRLFENSVSVQHLSEEFVAVQASGEGSTAGGLMKRRGFDTLGVEEEGSVFGYIERTKLEDGPLEGQIQVFHPSELVADSTPLLDVLPILLGKPRVFVLKGNRVAEIVARADLQKVPVRMLIFGLISLLEMNFLELIREYYPDDGWEEVLSDSRLKSAQDLFELRQQVNEEIDLIDCIQLSDKGTLILKNDKIRVHLGLDPISDGRRELVRIERLRNKLSHAQDIVQGSSWPEIIKQIDLMERLVTKCEDLLPTS